MVSSDIGIWVGAIGTIFVYTYFIQAKQNILFRFAQSTVIGCALGYTIAIVMARQIDYIAISRITQGQIVYIIPILLGLMVYLRLYRPYVYLSRTPIAIIVAVGLALGARGGLDAEVFAQMAGAASWSLITPDIMTAINNMILIVGMVSSVAYFFFTFRSDEIRGLKQFANIGRYFLMVYFGAKFGATIMFRLTLFLGRMQYLLYDWLGLGA